MKIVVYGTGILGELACHYFETDSPHEVAGFSVDADYIKESTFCDRPVVAFEEITKHFPAEKFGLFVAVGYTGLNSVRQERINVAKTLGYTCVSYVSSRATNLCVEIGENCFVLENSVLQPFSRIGDGAIFWPGTVISHHSVIGDFCYFSPNTTIAGGANIGARLFAGAGSVVRDGAKIPADVVLGMGAVVTGDLSKPGVYTGLPAKFVRRWKIGMNI